MATSATLDGYPLQASADVSWALTTGVRPHIAQFECSPEVAAQLVKGGLRPVTLVYGSRSGRVEINNLYVLHESPPSDDRWSRITVADRRYFWPRSHVERSYNLRWHIGVKRTQADGNNPRIMDVVPDVQYKPYTLINDKLVWTAKDVLADIMPEILRAEEEIGANPQWEIDADFAEVPIESLELAESGDQALQRVLSYLSTAEVTVDANGTIRLFSRASGKEDGLLADMIAPTEGGGSIRLIDMARVRPAKVRVLFVPEVEMRVDFTETDTTSSRTVPANEANNEGRYAENVLQLPDFTLQLGGRTVDQGTWVTFREVLDAWGSIPLPNGATLSLTMQTIRRSGVPFVSMWAGFAVAGAFVPDADWSGRLASIETHFRRTYRINPRVIARVQQLLAYRVATVDQATGTRAPSQAWQDYAILNNSKSLFVEQGLGRQLAYAINVDGYPTGGLLSNATTVPPLTVRILDHDQGIVAIEHHVDAFKLETEFLPSKIVNMPQGDPLEAGRRPIAFNALSEVTPDLVPELSPDHSVIMILTVVPGAPNNNGRLYAIEREIGDVAKFLPPSLVQGGGSGPTLEVRVGQSYASALIPWSDDRSTDIDRLLGILDGVPNLDDLVLNRGVQADIGVAGASLDTVADVVAAREYARFASRHEGTAETRMIAAETAQRLDGFLEEIRHSVAAGRGGEATTTVSMAAQPADVKMLSLMDPAARALILRQPPAKVANQ